MSFSPRVRLWARQDGVDENRPKAIALDAAKGPAAGRVFDVRATNTADAKRALAAYLAPEPSEVVDPHGWIAWRQARRDVQEVTS